MNLKKYLCVEAEHIRLIDYIFTDHDSYNSKYTYPKPHSIAVGGDDCVNIFEKNDIPLEYQKMYMVYNSLNINKRFKAKEYLTDTIISLSINKNGNIFGQMSGDNPTFDVSNCFECNKEDVLEFLTELREEQLLDNYLKALGEIIHLNIKSYFDTNTSKVKKKTK